VFVRTWITLLGTRKYGAVPTKIWLWTLVYICVYAKLVTHTRDQCVYRAPVSSMQSHCIISLSENSVDIQLSPYGCVWESLGAQVSKKSRKNSYYLKSERTETSFDVREEYNKMPQSWQHWDHNCQRTSSCPMFEFQLKLRARTVLPKLVASHPMTKSYTCCAACTSNWPSSPPKIPCSTWLFL